jgi:hypothetical protein
MRFLFIITMVLYAALLPKRLFCQNKIADSVIIEINNKEYLYSGYLQENKRIGLWMGTNLKTDSVEYILVYSDGYLMKKYYLDYQVGPLLEMKLSNSYDSLYRYTYDVQGQPIRATVWYVVNDSLLKRNCIDFCATEEGAVILHRNTQYIYNYFGIIDMTQVRISCRTQEPILLYYYQGVYVCTLDENGKLRDGSKRKYNQIMKNHGK